ncbi:MAG TPA: hypothetical protein ENG83_03100 [Nitrospirae bacterium]|nr:hypothetical protein BMS3Abin06_02805 [bacterium BMS3Abin06]HDH11180.1 hypothetical protein [Nitrospirota bacterium]HDY99943.1 hypothetical protein [Nitrospirota bacterium]
MSKKANFLYAILLLFFFCKSIYAIETNIVQKDGVIVQYEKSLQTVAKEIIRIYPAVKRELEKTFGSEIEFRPTVILTDNRKDFRKMVGNDLVVAIAVPQNNLIVIDNSKMKTGPFTLEITLKHELCHLLLYHYTEGGNLPKWLNEGISQWVTGGISEMIMGENKNLLKQATLSGRFIPIKDLATRFPNDDKNLMLAYQESRSMVDYIDREFGPGKILQILRHLKNGDNADTAILKGLSISPEELESNWHDFIRKKFTWFTYLSSHLYQLLFFLAALILIYGFIQFIIKKRAYRDEEEDDTIV